MTVADPCPKKFCSNGVLYEAAMVGDEAKYLSFENGELRISDRIETASGSILPPREFSYLSMPYQFDSEASVQKLAALSKMDTLDSLYSGLKAQWVRYAGGTAEHSSICAADAVFTYQQDKIGSTHYLAFTGSSDFDTIANLQLFRLLGSRAYFDLGLSPASIYHHLGAEEGQGILVDGGAGNLEDSREKMRIFRSGFALGAKVIRMERIRGKSEPKRCFTFCFKAWSVTDGFENNGRAKTNVLDDLTFYIPCIPVSASGYDLEEVINHGGEQNLKALYDEITLLRNRLLLYRVLHFQNPLPRVNVLLTGQEKRLCYPLARLFCNTTAIADITESLGHFIAARRRKRQDTLEGQLFRIIIGLAPNSGYRVTNADVWRALKHSLPGQEAGDKTQSYHTETFGIVSQKQVFQILRDRFHGVPTRDKQRGFEFDKSILERLATTTFNTVDQASDIKILADGSGNSKNDATDNGSALPVQIQAEIGQEKQEQIKPLHADPVEPQSIDASEHKEAIAATLSQEMSKASKVSDEGRASPKKAGSRKKPKPKGEGLATMGAA